MYSTVGREWRSVLLRSAVGEGGVGWRGKGSESGILEVGLDGRRRAWFDKTKPADRYAEDSLAEICCSARQDPNGIVLSLRKGIKKRRLFSPF